MKTAYLHIKPKMKGMYVRPLQSYIPFVTALTLSVCRMPYVYNITMDEISSLKTVAFLSCVFCSVYSSCDSDRRFTFFTAFLLIRLARK